MYDTKSFFKYNASLDNNARIIMMATWEALLSSDVVSISEIIHVYESKNHAMVYSLYILFAKLACIYSIASAQV